MKLIPLSELSGRFHREEHRAWEDTYTSKKRELILGSLSKAFPALQDLHSYILLLPTEGITAVSQCVPGWPANRACPAQIGCPSLLPHMASAPHLMSWHNQTVAKAPQPSSCRAWYRALNTSPSRTG